MRPVSSVIVIPTRNRAEIAMNAIRSVLRQPVGNVQLMVSDNSTLETELEGLAAFCATESDERLRYVRPPKPLPMPAHWDWAIHEAMQYYPASHFIYLTDRMMFKADSLNELLAAASQYPDKIISYNHDRIIDDCRPVRIEQYCYTGQLFEVSTERLSQLYSQGMFHHAFPKMLNCIVPREILERIEKRFGTVFSSISPDFLFCCRCLETEESIIFYDKSLLFHYALEQSHGASISRGELTPANLDFRANLSVDESRRNYATPIPELNTCVNAVYNEYLIVKSETDSARFYDIDFDRYLRLNAEEVEGMTNPELKTRMRELLSQHGFKDHNGAPKTRSVTAIARQFLSPRSVWHKIKTETKTAAGREWTKAAWLFLARTFGIHPPAHNDFVFASVEEAIEYMQRFPRPRIKNWSVQYYFLQPRELPLNCNNGGRRMER